MTCPAGGLQEFVNKTSGSLLRALRELKRVDEILQASRFVTHLTRDIGVCVCAFAGMGQLVGFSLVSLKHHPQRAFLC